MRIAGEPWFDPPRPQAQAIWSRTWQTTMLMPQRLVQVTLEIELDRARLQAGVLPPADSDALVTLLAALVTRSGYTWRPHLLPTPGGPPA